MPKHPARKNKMPGGGVADAPTAPTHAPPNKPGQYERSDRLPGVPGITAPDMGNPDDPPKPDKAPNPDRGKDANDADIPGDAKEEDKT